MGGSWWFLAGWEWFHLVCCFSSYGCKPTICFFSYGFVCFSKISSCSNWVTFMETQSRFFSRSVTLWLHFGDLFWYHVLERVSSLMIGFYPLPGNRISFNRFWCIQKLLREFEFIFLVFSMVFLFWHLL